METPRKNAAISCVVCGKDNLTPCNRRKINSGIGKKKGYQDLIRRYGEVDIVEGYLCFADERKLLNLDKKVQLFRDQVAETLSVKGKRCLKVLSPNKESTQPLKRAKSLIPHGDISLDSPVSATIRPLTTSTPVLACHKNNHHLALGKKLFSSGVSDISVENDSFIEISDKDSESGYFSCDHSYASVKKSSSKEAPKTSKDEGIKSDITESVLDQLIYSKPSNTSTLSSSEIAEIFSVLPSGSVQLLVDILLSMPQVRNTVIHKLLQAELQDNPILRNRKHGKLSYLMTSDYEDLKQFNWESVVAEMRTEFPMLTQACLTFMLPRLPECESKDKNIIISKVVPKLGMIYAIMAQTRNNRLSKIQKVINMLLFENICDQKVFDRLHPLGLCMSYTHSLSVLDKFAGNFKHKIIDAIKERKRIRIVGDNINWYTGVHDVRHDRHGHMNHGFGSAIIVQNMTFDHLSNIKPQQDYRECCAELFLPSSEDWDLIKDMYISHSVQVAVKHMAAFHFLKNIDIEKHEEIPRQREKNKVIPLPMLFLNEQKYEDVVQIMDYYEDLLTECHEEAGEEIDKVHIGGDQLTRERFSGAKRLRIGGVNNKQKYQHLSPITFEMFHLLMNFVTLIMQQLYSDKSTQEIGTMRCEQNRILRDNVSTNTNEHYDGNRDFIVSFVDSYIAEAIMDFFGMEDVHSKPSKNIPPVLKTSKEKTDWVRSTFGTIVNKYVHQVKNPNNEEDVIDDGVVLKVKLADGQTKSIRIKKKHTVTQPDRVKNYGHLTLELGMLFKSLLNLCKCPDQTRGIALLKVTMFVMKANNKLSKYAYEIMRFLVHQLVILSEKEAAEEFYGLFVNTSGRLDSFIPCDLAMEYQVKLVKKHLRHMFSNQTEKNVSTRTGALHAIGEISGQFDSTSKVIIRAKKHSSADSRSDEAEMINDLRNLKPFQHQAGRLHHSFPKIHSSMFETFLPECYREWIHEQKFKWSTEMGN